jgi:ribosomal protein S18 acetylase RimI-like enzyme
MRPIESSAFPPQKTPPVLSKVHQLFERHIAHSPFPEATIRRHDAADIEELKALQREWFPLNYSEGFYSKIIEGAAECFVAEASLTPDPTGKAVRAIVGAVVFEVTGETDHLVDNWVSRMLGLKHNAVYIMTLGVIDEMRSKGIAKRLLDKIIEFAGAEPRVQMIGLHVVDYNRRALSFYRKNGFVILEALSEHYHIMGREYGGLKLGLFVNGGERREGWGPWLRRVILRGTAQPEWPL